MPGSADERELQAAIGRDCLPRLAAWAAVAPLHQLQRQHATQWALEDRTRNRRARAEALVSAKRRIDDLNASRHQLIDAVDRCIPVSRGGGGRSYSETPGELCDRLIILGLKLARARALAEDPSLPEDDRGESAEWADRLRRWQSHLQRHLLGQLDDIAEGRADLPPRAERKLYRAEAAGLDHDPACR